MALLSLGGAAFLANELHLIDYLRGTPQWSITEQQERDLKTALIASPMKFNVLLSVVPAAPTDAMDIGYHLMQIIGASPGWHATLAVIDPEYSPRAAGLRVSVKVFTDPEKNEKAVTLKSILEKAGLQPFWGNDHGLPDGEAKIVVGVHP